MDRQYLYERVEFCLTKYENSAKNRTKRTKLLVSLSTITRKRMEGVLVTLHKFLA
jgi:hypothetical protein